MKHSLATVEEESDVQPQLDPKVAELMKQNEAAGKPGPTHKALEPLVGNWNAEVKCWMEPGAEPMVSRAAANSSWILDGRFVQEEFQGEFMGKPFEGMSLIGYDNLKSKYKSVWIDSAHTSMFISEGVAENGGKLITFEGRMDCPMSGQKDKLMKQVFRVISHDKHVFEMHDPSKGGNSKTMEIIYTRK